MKTWGVIGLGWLGAELARTVTARGGRAWGTHRGDFTFGRDRFPETKCDILVLDTPPLTSIEVDAYARAIPDVGDHRTLFVSSTSVYGAGGGVVNEGTPVHPESANARWLAEVEVALRSRLGDRLTVVRPGGLIGGSRHPARFLARSGRAIDDGPINLIHRLDLIEILITLADLELAEPVVNAVAPYHPDKSIYYFEWAGRLGLGPIPVRGTNAPGRIVESEVLSRLEYRWLRPRLDRLD